MSKSDQSKGRVRTRRGLAGRASPRRHRTSAGLRLCPRSGVASHRASAVLLWALHRRQVRRAHGRRGVQDREPGHRGGSRGDRRRRPRGRGHRGGGGPACPARGLGPHAGRRKGEVHLQDRPHHPGALPGARSSREPGQRQADPRVARRRRAAGRGSLLLLRGVGRQARVRRFRAESGAPWRSGAGHPLELPLDDGGLEARPGARGGQHLCPQARIDDPAHRPFARRDHPAGRPASRRGQRHHRGGLGGGGGAGGTSGSRQGGLHGLDRDRQGPATRPWPGPAST